VSGSQIVKTGKAKAGAILKLNKKRKLQPWQAYHSLTYESKWKEEIDHKWGDFVAAWSNDHPGQPVNKTRFEFMNTFIKDKYATESPEMKDKVEVYHQNVVETSSDDANRSFQE